nr:unnamed protein product [uncultured bacterium]
MSKTLDEYKDELYPLMYGRINEIFPDLHFTERRGKLVSPHHLDGHRDRQGKETLNISPDKPYSVYDLALRQPKNLIEWYMERNALNFWDALDRLSDICGMEKFVRTTESDKSKQIQENRQNALDLFTSSLWNGSEQAQRVLDYLCNVRTWTEEEIRKAELGLITSDLRPQLPDADYYIYGGIGKTHLLTIPVRTTSRILGFKFRCIDKDITPKYLNSKELKVNEGLFGLGIGLRDIVVTEGELDALHAQVRGVDNITATLGGGISQAQAQDAIRKGVKRFTLLFDNDEGGREFTSQSLALLESMGAEVYVAKLPDGIKDTDEYLRDHNINEWREIIKFAQSSASYKLEKIVLPKYIEISNSQRTDEYPEGHLSEKQVIDFYSEVEKLFLTPYMVMNPHLREPVFNTMEYYAPNLQLDPSDFRKWINNSVDRQRAAQRETDVRKAVNKIDGLLKEGKVEDALSLMRETEQAQAKITTSETYSSLLHDDIDETLSSMRNEGGGITTNIELSNGYRFFCPSGAISIIGAPTGHGKSKMLISLALDELSRNTGGTLLYVTYEESKTSVLKQMINAYADLTLTAQTGKHGNLQTIGEYFSTGSTAFIRQSVLSDFKGKVEEFKSLYRENRIKLIRPTDDYSTTLCNLLRYAISELGNVRGVFIDYAQKLYLPDAKAKARTDELKQVMSSLDLIAQETHLPIIMGAQVSRDTTDPLSMDNQKIADSAWIERTASEILLLWSNKEKVKNDKDDKISKKVESQYPTLNLGGGGKILAILTKTRYNETGITAILDIDGNTGRIKGNVREENPFAQSSTSCPPLIQERQRITYDDEETDVPF